MNPQSLFPAVAAAPRRLGGGLGVVLLALLLAPRLPAQVVNDGATNTLNGVTSNVTGTVTVGTNGSFTLLSLTNGALLTNSGDGLIGRNAGAHSNTVRVHGPNSAWRMGGSLYVGSNSAFNSLLIANGGVVANNLGFVGYGVGANSNLVSVTGSNSVWENAGEVNFGYQGAGNAVVITGGARVGNANGAIGNSSVANNNQVSVDGAGSSWSNRGDLYVGLGGSGNQLIITNGAQVGNGTGLVGYFASAGSNAVVVTGSNSWWSNRASLYLGVSGSGNTLLVSNGGQLRAPGGYVG